jgi:Tfp pilus assembly PilM family ATPase
MARPSDISSTEKLLRIIRSKQGETAAASAPREIKLPKAGRIRLRFPFLLPLRKSSTAGIDIAADGVRIVTLAESGSGQRRILERQFIPLPPNLSREAPEFAPFLKTALEVVCGSPRRLDIWAMMSTARVDVRHIRIPKVTRKQLDNAVYWTIKKEAPFDEKETIFDYTLQGEVIEQGVPRLSVLVCTAPRQEVETLKNLFGQIGWPLKGISIAPFAIQNLFQTEWMPSPEGTVASLFMGNDFSRIDIFAEGNLVLSRDIRAGLNSLNEALSDGFPEANRGLRGAALTPEQGRKILQSLGPNALPLVETDTGYGLEKAAILKKIEPALDRLARQVERTFEHYRTVMSEKGISGLFASGVLNISRPLADYMGAQLGIASSVLDPFAGEEAHFDPGSPSGDGFSEESAFGPALGLSLSDNDHTPNLIFTCKDKERETKLNRINQGILAAIIAALLIGSAVYGYGNHLLGRKKAELAGIEAQLNASGPVIPKEELIRLGGEAAKQGQLFRIQAERYLGVALLSELESLTLPHIHFLDLRIALGEPVKKTEVKPAADKPAEAPKPRIEEVTVEGLILGDRQSFATSLASYVMALEASPLFKQVTVQKNGIEPYGKGDALHFILSLKIEEQVHG